MSRYSVLLGKKKEKNLGSLVQPLYHSSDVHKNISEQKYQGTSLPLLGLFAGFCIEQKSVIFFDSAELMPKSKGKASVPGQQRKEISVFTLLVDFGNQSCTGDRCAQAKRRTASVSCAWSIAAHC